MRLIFYTIWEQTRITLIIWIVSILLPLFSTSRGVRTSCEISSAYVGQTANLTCDFYEDITKLQKNLKVIHHKYSDSASVSVILCHWTNNGESCHGKGRYIYNGIQKTRLNAVITNVNLEDNGKMWCQVFNSSLESYEKCNFTVKTVTAPSTRTDPSSTFAAETNLDTKGEKGHGHELQTHNISIFQAVTATMIYLTVVLVAIILTLVVIVLRKTINNEPKTRTKTCNKLDLQLTEQTTLSA